MLCTIEIEKYICIWTKWLKSKPCKLHFKKCRDWKKQEPLIDDYLIK